MTTQTKPMEKKLESTDARVLACLAEKSMTTPDYYPLTLKALTAACNQKSNRHPVMNLGEKDVVLALDRLRDRQLAWSVTLAGSRTPHYRHSLTDVLPMPDAHLAILCELILRGPQTLGELRTHTARMIEIPDLTTVQTIVQELADREDGPLVTVLPSQPGRREVRYAHLMCGAPVEQHDTRFAVVVEPARQAVMAENDRLSALEAKTAALENELARLTARFSDFERQFQ